MEGNRTLIGVGGRWQPPFHGYRETLREERPLLGESVLRNVQGPHFCTFSRKKFALFAKLATRARQSGALVGDRRSPFASLDPCVADLCNEYLALPGAAVSSLL